jgi:hypothetical protein
MKSYPILLILLLSAFTFSCTDSLTDLGKGIQPSSDQIQIGADTVHLTTENVPIDSVMMTMNPDSFLLGTYEKNGNVYGSTRADIYAQIYAPNFVWKKGYTPDSAKVFMYYNSYFGDSYSPMEVSIYRITGPTFGYSTPYPTNLDPTVYTNTSDTSLLMGKKVFTARNAATPTTTQTTVSIPLSKYFAINRFFPDTAKTDYYSPENFLKFFKGMYITTNYGSATMLNVSKLALLYYYHYTYTYKKSNGVDSVSTVNDVLTFPASDDVRQINRFTHYGSTMLNLDESNNYIVSPANMQTRVIIPMKSIQQKLNEKIAGNKKQVINNASLQVDVANVNAATDTLAMPAVKYLLLIKESAINRFFTKKELPSDTCAIIGTYTQAEIGTTGTYKYYYTFGASGLIANELKKNPSNEKLNMRLIPVKVTYNSSGNITAVTNQTIMSGVTIKSGKSDTPMSLKLVYSGF